MIDDNTLFEAGGGIVATGIAWFVRIVKGTADEAKQSVIDLERSTNEKISKLTDNLSEYKVFIAASIPTKVEMNAAVLRTEESVRRINDRLDEISNSIIGKSTNGRP